MSANSYLLGNLCAAVASYVAVPGVLVVTHDDWRLADEDHFSIPGYFLPMPALIVGCESAPVEGPLASNPQSLASVIVRLRSGLDATSAPAHAALAATLAELLWDEAALLASLSAYPNADAPVLLVSGVANTEQRFEQLERVRETRFLFNVQIAPHTT